MPSIHPHPVNLFSGSPLDRIDFRRREPDWVASQLAAHGSRFLPVWRSRNFVTQNAEGTPQIGTIAGEFVAPLLGRMPWALLGLRGEAPHFAIDLSSLDAPLPAEITGSFEDLRRLASLMDGGDASILAHARSLMHWRTRHRFCPVCGAACVAEQAGHVMACTGCGTHHFPRTDAAVIMLVTKDDRALLGRSVRFSETPMYSTLAGFVEPGEALEEAVAREVFEESGIRVANVRYSSSQPWPFPANIMLGFTADAVTDEITFDPHEMLDARWFTRGDLENPKGFVLPGHFSIARRLIEDWRRG